MKKLLLITATFLVLASCGDNGEKKATIKLDNARTALGTGDYGMAKLEIDSIKILYPKAVNARREGIRLMQEVELAEQTQSVAYMDSILTEKKKQFEEIKARFVLEKDAEYQDVGNYFWPTQTVEKNLHRAYLRFQVDENGVMTMTSIYCGKNNINHVGVKVTAPDGTFAETPASEDVYMTTDLGEKIEKADYRMGKDGSVIGFIALNRDKNLKVQYIGERKFNTTLSAADRTAAAELYELSQLLSSIRQIENEMKEANLKIDFVKRNMEKSNTEEVQ